MPAILRLVTTSQRPGKPAADQVTAFRASVAPDQYDVQAFLPWDQLDAELRSRRAAIHALQGWVNGRRQEIDLAKVLRDEPSILDVIRLLVVAPSGVGFRDGRELPGGNTEHDTDRVAKVVLDLGLRRLLPPNADVESLCRVALVANDARKRGVRRRETLNQRVDRLLNEAVQAVEKRSGVVLVEVPTEDQPRLARGRGIVVLGTDDRPIAAVANVFQDSSGGRQQRDLSATYPRLQEDLDAIPMSLLVVADGRGVAEAPDRILTTLFESVAGCMTMEQAERGMLADGLERALVSGGAREATRGSLSNLIDLALRSRPTVEAEELPVPNETARLALSGFATEHPELALELAVDGSALRWTAEADVAEAHELRDHYDADGALQLLSRSLRLQEVVELPSSNGLAALQGRPPADAVLPEVLVIGAVHNDWGEAEMREVARAARERVPNSTLAILLVPHRADPESKISSRAFQRQLATTVVPVDVDSLPEVVGASSPRNALVDLILRSADLTKTNPFTVMGVTPPEMFYGRTVEEADLMATLATNSAALIGGRRIGKTSLLQRVTETLEGENWSPYYADLQEAGDWRTFADHVSRRWEVDLPKDFAPSNIEALVAQLKERSEGRLVIALDEVDYLLKWDQDHGGAFPPEAFFRACRAVSQEGTAQFVFSGERTIAQRLWDPASPHWNFCRPLPIKQLTRADADDLLANPLRALGVKLDPHDECLELAWDSTQGHPQIVQFIGDKLVRLLNDRPSADRSTIEVGALRAEVEDDEFSQHYLTTYWGQATDFEKLLTALLAAGSTNVPELRDAFNRLGRPVTGEHVTEGLRMLDLYGIVDGMHDELEFRATHMPAALELLGGAETVATDLFEADVP